MKFKQAKNGYDMQEVDAYIKNLRTEYERTTSEQKIRISDLKREVESKTAELISYKSKNSDISNALIVKETNQIGHVWHHSPDHLYQDYFVTQYIIFASLWEFSFRLASSRIFHTTISSPSARFEHKT